jgi:hypothetical protein
MLGEPENQFSLTRAALSTSGHAKSDFLSVQRNGAAQQPHRAGLLQGRVSCISTTALLPTIGLAVSQFNNINTHNNKTTTNILSGI